MFRRPPFDPHTAPDEVTPAAPAELGDRRLRETARVVVMGTAHRRVGRTDVLVPRRRDDARGGFDEPLARQFS